MENVAENGTGKMEEPTETGKGFLPCEAIDKSKKSGTARDLVQRVLEVIKEVTGLQDVDPDEDGDISVTYADIPIYITIRRGEPSVLFHSPLLNEVKEDDLNLLKRLNKFNSVEQRAQVFIINETVFATRELRIFRFSKLQVSSSFKDFSQAIAKLRSILDLEFGKSQGTPGITQSALIH